MSIGRNPQTSHAVDPEAQNRPAQAKQGGSISREPHLAGGGEEPGARSMLAELGAAIRKRRRFILVWSVTWLSLAVWLVFQLTPYYRSEVLVMLDTRDVHYAEMRAVLTRPTNVMDPNIVRTEAELLSSSGLARRVIEDLDLVNSPEFATSPSLLYRLANWGAAQLQWATEALGLPLGRLAVELAHMAADSRASDSAGKQFERVVDQYRRRMNVFTDGRSYVINLSFEARDPDAAARIINRHAEFYVDDQRRMKNEALAGASGWLDREVHELAGRLARAERALQEYREQNQLFASRGVSLVAQQMVDLNSQLTVAQSELAQREARLRSLREGGGRGVSGTEVTGSYNIGRLREQEADALRREADVASMYGDRHPAMMAARAQRIEVQRKIQEEVQKISRGIESEVAIAEARVSNLRATMADLTGKVAATERGETRMRELQREVDATRSLYESLLARQKQVSTQEGIQQADARVVSRAVAPTRPSFPNKVLFLCVAAMVSLASAIGIVLARERMRSSLGSAAELEQQLGLPVLGSVPIMSRRMPLSLAVVEQPRSAVSEAMRNLRYRIALSVRQNVSYSLVVTSAVPGEGKTSVALALARSMAGSGLSVLLVDADLRRPQVAPMVWGRNETEGLTAVLQGTRSLGEVVRQDPKTPLRILPAEGGSDVVAPQDLFAAPSFGNLLDQAKIAFDCVIIDTPPVGLLSDAVLIGQRAMGAIMVVRSEHTPAAAARTAIQNLVNGGVPILGAVLNFIDLTAAPKSAADAQFYHRRHQAYFKA